MPASPFEIVTSADRLGHIANEILDAQVIGLDIETTGYDSKDPKSKSNVFEDDIRIVSVNTGKAVYVIDLYQTHTLGQVVPALAESKGVKVIQNAKYEQKWFLQKYGIELWPIFDTYRASVLIHNGRDLPNDLYALYERELKMAPPTRDLGASDWAGTLTPEHYEYAGSDVSYLFELRDSLKPKLSKFGLNKIALIEFGAVLPEAAVELNGFPLDSQSWLALAEENAHKAEELRKQLVWEMPNPKNQLMLAGIEPGINLDSPQQMLASLRKLGLEQQCEECRGRGTMRDRSECKPCLGTGIVPLQNTREMTLAMFAADYPVIKKLMEYRDYSKKVSSFGPDYLANINPLTNRIHGEYFPFTGAGRYAMSKPNLQQIPRLKAFRSCFKAPPGNRFVVRDYSNVEMRILAEITNDPILVEVFNRPVGQDDAHRTTAAALLGLLEEQVTKDQRQQAKPVNFGFCYGMQAPKMVLYAQANYNVTLSLKQATAFRDKYFEIYKGVRRWHERVFSDAHKARGRTSTLGGRLRYLPEDAHNEYANTEVQGTGADGLKAALRNVYMRLKKYSPWNGPIRMIHHVHDEVITQTPDDEEISATISKEVGEGMEESMQQFIKRVPIVTEGGSGYSWAEK